MTVLGDFSNKEKETAGRKKQAAQRGKERFRGGNLQRGFKFHRARCKKKSTVSIMMVKEERKGIRFSREGKTRGTFPRRVFM